MATARVVNELDKWALDRWPTAFWELYRVNDEPLSAHLMWLHVVEHGSAVGEFVRRHEVGKALRRCAHVFCWLCSFVAKYQLDNYEQEFMILRRSLSQMAWHKYPYACPFCGKVPCHCPLDKGYVDELSQDARERHRGELEPKLAKRRTRRAFKITTRGYRIERGCPKTLSEFAEMFAILYGPAHHELSLSDIAFHFLEEIGEVAQVIRYVHTIRGWTDKQTHPHLKHRDQALKFYHDALCDEIGDTFSWLLAIVNKAQREVDLATRGTIARAKKPIQIPTLTEVLASEYHIRNDTVVRCHRCKKTTCSTRCLDATTIEKPRLRGSF